jgi:hypothetical protein
MRNVGGLRMTIHEIEGLRLWSWNACGRPALVHRSMSTRAQPVMHVEKLGSEWSGS